MVVKLIIYPNSQKLTYAQARGLYISFNSCFDVLSQYAVVTSQQQHHHLCVLAVAVKQLGDVLSDHSAPLGDYLSHIGPVCRLLLRCLNTFFVDATVSEDWVPTAPSADRGVPLLTSAPHPGGAPITLDFETLACANGVWGSVLRHPDKCIDFTAEELVRDGISYKRAVIEQKTAVLDCASAHGNKVVPKGNMVGDNISREAGKQDTHFTYSRLK